MTTFTRRANPDESFFPEGLVLTTPVLEIEWLEKYAWGWDVLVRQTDKKGPLHFALEAFHTPHIQFGKNRYSTAYLSQGSPPKGCIVLFYIQTPGIVNFRNEKYRPDELIVVSPQDGIDIVISTENVVFSIAVEERFFKKSFFAHYGRFFEETVTGHRFKLHSDTSNDFLRFAHRWLTFFQRHVASDRNAIEFDLNFLEQEFLHKLFGFFGLERPAKNRTDTTLLKRAREMLHESFDMHLKINEMSEMLGISQRTLEYTFRNNLGMSAKHYLQMLKLNAAREDLLHADPGTTKVSDIAIKYAFFHMSHFAAEYKKLFGETPAQTLHR